MDSLKHAIEIIITVLSSLIATFSPYLFLVIWCLLIVTSKFLLSREDRSASDFLRAIGIGVPIGVLFGMAAQEHGQPPFTSTIIGCMVSVLAEQILNGDLPRRFFDSFINKKE